MLRLVFGIVPEHCSASARNPARIHAGMLFALRPESCSVCPGIRKFSSGVIEGLNNKAKVTMRKSYGFRTFRVLKLALYHTLAKMPEPELTHEFF